LPWRLQLRGGLCGLHGQSSSLDIDRRLPLRTCRQEAHLTGGLHLSERLPLRLLHLRHAYRQAACALHGHGCHLCRPLHNLLRMDLLATLSSLLLLLLVLLLMRDLQLRRRLLLLLLVLVLLVLLVLLLELLQALHRTCREDLLWCDGLERSVS
jgi:hypothetical protein